MLWIAKSVRLDITLDNLLISSALPNDYVVTHDYSTDDHLWHCYVFQSTYYEQTVFSSLSDLHRSMNAGLLMIDNRHFIEPTGTLIVGARGSGKSYLLYLLILQLIEITDRKNLFFLDAKLTSVYKMGMAINPDQTAADIDDIIAVLRQAENALSERKSTYLAVSADRIDSTYTDFGLDPIVIVFDEYASFRLSLARRDKKVRDAVDDIVGTIVLEGRELGVFLYITMQQSGTETGLPTSVRDNLLLKIAMGRPERQTYVTCFGCEPDAANRRFQTGQGLLAFPQVAALDSPDVITVPRLDFDIYAELTAYMTDRQFRM